VPEKFVVNSEFPLFGDDGCMDFAKTKYDFELDNISLTPHIYTYEKITGGAYLGELFRITLVDLARNGLLLGGSLTEQLTTEGAIQSATLSLIEAEFEQNGSKAIENEQAAALFAQLGYSANQVGPEDCSIATYTAQLITVRSAIFIAAGTYIIF
jgi:hexokinase